MKVKVIMPFKDKETKKIHKPGEVIEVTKERYAEIRKAGNYVAEEKAEEAKATKATTATEKTAKKTTSKADKADEV